MYRISHLRYGVVLSDDRSRRFVVAVREDMSDPLVIVREEELYGDLELDYYNLYEHALTLPQAEEILGELQDGKDEKARALLLRYFDGSSPACEGVGLTSLEKTVSDDWYPFWEKMEVIATVSRNYPGYFEAQVEEGLPYD